MKKQYKEMYAQRKTPQIINCQEQIIISIEGIGNPNTSEQFGKHIEALYKVSYAFRMSYKKQPLEGYEKYVVAPLEGLWTTADNTAYDGNKDNLKYKIFIAQPSFVTKEIFEEYKKKLLNSDNYIGEVKYETINEGLVGQIMHIGPFDTEKESVTKLENYVTEHGYKLDRPSHHEIYIGDFRKAKPVNLKTIVRYKLVEENNVKNK